jgi:hypothetical protein
LFALVIQDGVAFAHQKQKEATIVSGMSIEIDSKDKAVIIAPRSELLQSQQVARRLPLNSRTNNKCSADF